MSIFEQVSQNQKEQAKEHGSSGGNLLNLWTRDGDVVEFAFPGPGKPDEPWMTAWVSHFIEPTQPGQFGTDVYCPNLSGHDPNYQDCKYCNSGEGGTMRARMRISAWLYVTRHFRSIIRQGEDPSQLPQVTMNVVPLGERSFYVYERNQLMYWEVSGFDNFSPTNDLIMLQQQMGGDLRTSMVRMIQIGDQLKKQLRFQAIPDQKAPGKEIRAALKTMVPIREYLLQRNKEHETPPVVQQPVQTGMPNMQPPPPGTVPPLPSDYVPPQQQDAPADPADYWPEEDDE